MRVVHGTWITKNADTFYNQGQFCLWVETGNKRKTTKLHPYTLAKSELSDFIKTDLGLAHEFLNLDSCYKNIYLTLPTANDAPIMSPSIARDKDAIIPERFSWETWQTCCVIPNNVITLLKQLSFLQLYFPEDIKFGEDLLFWCSFTTLLKNIISQDLYVPSLKAYKLAKKTQYIAGWEIIAPNYEAELAAYGAAMPIVCTTGFIKQNKGQRNSAISLLRHFNEYWLHHLLRGLAFTKKIEKSVAETVVAESISQNSIVASELKSQDHWQQLTTWKNSLSRDTTDANFYLGFRLIEPELEKNKNALWYLELLIEAKLDPSFKLTLDEYWQTNNKQLTLLGKDFEQHLLIQLGQAVRVFPKLETGLNSKTPIGIELTTAEAFTFLQEGAWVLQAAGYKIIIPAWWTPKGAERTRIKIKAKKSKPQTGSSAKIFSAANLVEYDYSLSINGEEISPSEWQTLINSKQQLVNFRGAWMELNPEHMQAMLEFWQKQPTKTASIMEMLQTNATSDDFFEFEFDKSLTAMMDGLLNKQYFNLISQPKNFHGKLRAYQQRGFSWLHYLEQIGLNPCLADDMGLGKTVQVIALILSDKSRQPCLLIAPTSVLGNWQRELEKFGKSIRTLLHHGDKRLKGSDFFAAVKKNQVVLTSFALVRRDNKFFKDINWQRIVVDEAQNIKNPSSEQTKTIFKLQAKHRIALTGTPIENRLLDLWSIFNFLNPGYLGSVAKFKKQFEKPIQRDNDKNQAKILKRLTEPFILRRLKTDTSIIKDLPKKVEQKLYCNLTKEQATLYQVVVDEIKKALEENLDGIKRKGVILSSLMQLKQICNHPAQFLQDASEFAVSRSHKLTRLTEMLQEAIDNQESLLIFTQFKEIAELLNHFLRTKYGVNTYMLHGGTKRKQREVMIQEFQNPETEPSAFILSLKAGGVGITLTKANHVFHFDRWWNPAVENQATDRAYRIGQKKTVFSHKFVTIGTLEERIDQMLEHKAKLADSIMGNDESWLTELDNAAFLKLIQLSKNAVL